MRYLVLLFFAAFIVLNEPSASAADHSTADNHATIDHQSSSIDVHQYDCSLDLDSPTGEPATTSPPAVVDNVSVDVAETLVRQLVFAPSQLDRADTATIVPSASPGELRLLCFGASSYQQTTERTDTTKSIPAVSPGELRLLCFGAASYQPNFALLSQSPDSARRSITTGSQEAVPKRG